MIIEMYLKLIEIYKKKRLDNNKNIKKLTITKDKKRFHDGGSELW